MRTLRPPPKRLPPGRPARLANNDAAGLLALYSPDATFETPLVPHLMQTERGILRGQAQLRAFFEKSDLGIPRQAPGAEQMDFVEVMEIGDDGLIARQRVYWGWFGIGILQRDAYRR